MLFLRTFGQLAVSQESGALAGGAGAQRKPLALLAVLAGAPGGLTRDRLIAFLWPELDETRGRRVLRQTLYALRRDLGARDLFIESTAVRLNPGVIRTDVEAFDRAGRAQAWAEAVEFYRGPFLDGFYLPDAAEFERWVEVERTSHRERYRGARERLAEAATARSDPREAVQHWRALVADDPLDGRLAIGLMRALVAAGMLAPALKCARQHSAVVQDELGTGPDPEIPLLVDRIREQMAVVPAATLPGPEAAPSPARSDRSRRWPVLAALTGVLLLALGGLAALRGRSPEPGAPPADGNPAVVVFPFTDESPLVKDRFFGAAVAGELTRELAQISSLRVLTSGPRVMPESPEGRRSLAAEIGAAMLVEGMAHLDGGRVHLRVQLVDGRSGELLWSTRVERDLAALPAVHAGLARDIAGTLHAPVSPREGQRLNRPSAADPDAYADYLRASGLRLGSPAENSAGIEVLRQAVRRDSSFALAYAALARRFLFHAYLVDPVYGDSGLAAANRALRLDDGLSSAHFAIGDLQVLRGRPATARLSFLRALEFSPSEVGAMADLSDADATLGLYDESLYWALRALPLAPHSEPLYAHVGTALYHLAADEEAEAWLARAEARWPEYGRFQIGLMRQELIRGRAAEALARARRLVARDPGDGEAQVALAQAAVLAGAPDAERLVRAELAARPDTRPYGLTAETFRTLQAMLRLKAGDREGAGRLLDTAFARVSREVAGGFEDPTPAVELAAIYALRGRNDLALDWLERAHEAGWRDHRLALRDPCLSAVRDEPRFVELVRRMEAEVAGLRERALASEGWLLARSAAQAAPGERAGLRP